MELGNLSVEDMIKAGWSAGDVKEILSLLKVPEQTPPANEHTAPTQESEIEQTTPEIEQTEGLKINEAFQAEIDKMRTELNQAKQDLAAAQALNRRQNFSDIKESDEDIFTEFIKSY